LSFRQFLGLSTGAKPASTTSGTTSSNFDNSAVGTTGAGGANGGSTTGNINGGSGTNGNGTGGGSIIGGAVGTVQTSQFTNQGINPGNVTNGTIPTTTINGSTIAGGTIPTSTGGSTGGTTPTGSTTGSTTTIAPVCSDEDLNITFTADELARLNVLQDRFYTIAQTLHTDADVDTEVANHDAFTVKTDQVKELYAYCESKLPYIDAYEDRRLHKHMATPFWHEWYPSVTDINATFNASEIALLQQGRPDPSEDQSFLDYISYCGGASGCIGHIGQSGLLDYGQIQSVQITGSALGDTGLIMPVVERIMRINLW